MTAPFDFLIACGGFPLGLFGGMAIVLAAAYVLR